EWVTDSLGAQGAVCSGGRYDGLVEQLGGRPTPAVGWAMGVERLVELLRLGELGPVPSTTDVYLLPLGQEAETQAVALAESLRDALPALELKMHCGGGSLKSRMKRADRSGAELALIVGEDEVRSGAVMLRPLRRREEQISVPLADIEERILHYCSRLSDNKEASG
ncbi:MAG: His/Gly/Thr/Pro-type tRNA ligase C-terminal domain-containing protein, partial [Gammaproteobacteria bacterium]